jgi:hypothetical protein
MKKTIMTITAALAMTAATQAIEVLKGDERPAGCESIAEIRAGNLFARHSKDIAVQSVVEDAEKLNAQKVSVQLIRHQHPKLGTDYTAVGTAWKCAK